MVGEDLAVPIAGRAYVSDDELVSRLNQAPPDATMKALGDEAPPRLIKQVAQPHNTINRVTHTTGEGMFAPFEEEASFLYPGIELAILVLIDPEATDRDRIATAVERIGKCGYGKNASTGLGRFVLRGCRERELPTIASPNACYTLAPCVPQKGAFAQFHFMPFIRFGKHGDLLGRSRNPFKNPVVMADEGAVLIAASGAVFEKPCLGSAVLNSSKTMPQTVAQGYAMYLPCRVEI